MADISSYPQATPKGSDRVLGVQAYVEGDDSTAGNPTKTFTINDINNLVPRSDGDSLYIDTVVSSAELLDLHNTSVVLIPQSTNNNRWSVNKIIIQYKPEQTPYTSGGSNFIAMQVKYFVNGVDVNKTASSSCFFDGSLSSGNNSRNSISTQTNSILFCPDEPASVNIVPQNPNPITGGDGTIKVRTYYSVTPSTF